MPKPFAKHISDPKRDIHAVFLSIEEIEAIIKNARGKKLTSHEEAELDGLANDLEFEFLENGLETVKHG